MKPESTVTFEGCEIYETIHIGAEIRIYRGRDMRSGRPVIIKHLPKMEVFDTQVINLKNEYDILNQITSERLLKVYSLERSDKGYVLLMEDSMGKSLKSIISSGPLNLESFYKIALSLCDILNEIHRNKIIHKDIKSDNIIANLDTFDTRIIDFGISTRLSREETKLMAPNVLEGSIQYISPEQTGRMNRSIDYRSDFYSLGVTFYEILTGSLPFLNEDLLELVHSHLAKSPVPPIGVNPNLPLSLSDIIMKLMAKTAELRYQTALGLKSDLQKSYDNYTSGTKESFDLGSHDISDEFRVPQKLYGRETDVQTLLQRFKEVKASGKTESILIGGYSGVGKSSLIKEINKPITEFKGYFSSGKFDQYNRNLPFSGIIQALTNLLQLILTEEQSKIDEWKKKILLGLGSNGKIICDVIPDLVYIIGEQPEVVELGSQENANRFYIVFQNFFKVFADEEHPLAIFLDDMQWCDTSSLIMLKNLLVDTSVKYILLMFAYRDNETDVSHPFITMIDALKKENGIVNTITLRPLDKENVIHLIRDTLSSDENSISELGEILHLKTGGNPFFINELLKMIHKNKLISFEHEKGKWLWDLEKIKQTSISNNVVELLIGRIKKFSDKTQHILKLAACIGNEFDLGTLSIINESNPYDTEAEMLECIQEELVVNIGDNWKRVSSMKDDKVNTQNFSNANSIRYKFQHDRVQQASYELIADADKKKLRLGIGRIILEKTEKADLEDHIFEIVNHVNSGIELVTESGEKEKYSMLNYQAGKKAKSSAAYKPSLYYFTLAMEHLPANSWQKNYTNTFAVYKERAELEFLNGNFEKSEELITILLEHAKSEIEKADIYYLLMLRFIIALKAVEAIDAGKKGLTALKLALPEENLGEIIGGEMKAVEKYETEEDLERLYNKQSLEDPSLIAGLKIMNNLSPAAYLAGQGELWALIALKGVNLSINNGIHAYSSVAFAEYSLILAAYGNYKRALLFGSLGLRLSEKWGTFSLFQKARNSLVVGNFINPWMRHISESQEINASGYQAGLDSGNLIYAGYILLNQPLCSFYQGLPLKSVLEKLPASMNFTKKNKDELSYNAIVATKIIASALAGLTESDAIFDIPETDEKSYLANCHTVKDFWSVSQYLNLKSQALYHFGLFEQAEAVIEEAKQYLGYTQGLTTIISSHNFYSSLILTAIYSRKDRKTQRKILATVKANQVQMKIWADNCPENFLHKYLLIEAELGRIRQHKKWKVIAIYQRAIEEARVSDYIQNEALANELAANFWIESDQKKFAEIFFFSSIQRYEEWGAYRKSEMLKVEFNKKFDDWKKDLTTTISNSLSSSPALGSATTSYSGQSLDLQTVIKSSNVIAAEIKLESLLGKLMKIMIENAGAQRGVLLLRKEGSLFIEAEGRVDSEHVNTMESIPAGSSDKIPASIVYYVERTKQSLVLSDASTDAKFNQDVYVKANHPKSVLCSPIMQKGVLTGILYLENNLTEGAFTPDRLQIINILSGQAAISIDNAMLYANMEQKVMDRTHELAQANEELGEKNKNITSSIEYSLTIQQAILPAQSVMRENFKDFFLLYRPKDIVAGDFYWFSKLENDDIFIVAADCTGHGVPGALMSMIGHNFLNQIVNEKKITDPAEILHHLNKSVRIALKQDLEFTESRDGMDLCLLKISGNKATYAGAKRPLIVSKDGILEIIKGDVASIGGRQKSDKDLYTNKEVEILPGKTNFYLTTDGYIDQPDPNRNKIGTKKLTEIIQQVHALDADEQLKKFSEKLDNHKSHEEQRDDITVICLML